ncbi:MAG TPA: DEAD/DEAH box helicase, partial [Polyangia bacterium]
LYPVELGDGGPRLGELDEEFVFESRVGDVFQLGSGTWRIERIGLQRVTVGPAPGEPPRLPFWHGEGPGRSAELGAEVGALCRRFEDAPEAAPAWLVAEHHLTARAAVNLSGYLADQRAALGVLPTDRRVVVEHFTDELGDRRLAIHTPLGKRVTTPLGLVLARRLAEVTGVEPSWVAADDGVLFRLPAAEAPPPGDPLKLLSDLDLERALTVAVGASTLFGARFRENAARALLLPRRAPGRRTPLYLQRLRAQDLLEVARRHPDFPVLVETYRECLRDTWDVERLARLLAEIASGHIEVAVRETPAPSPFAANLLFGFLISFLYNDDLPRAEKRLQLLPVGRGLLAGILAAGEIGALLDPAVLADEEARATRTDPRLRARDPDELHDLLRRLGPLRDAEVAERIAVEGGGPAALAALSASGRAVKKEDRWFAAEDLERDAAARAAIPDLDAADAITRRALRASGPVAIDALADRAALPLATVKAAIERLIARGEAVTDRFHPEAVEPEYADPAQVDRLHRRSLAAARRAVRPVSADRYAAFALAWQHLTPAARLEGPGGLERVLGQLAGFAVPGELFERQVLARRLRAYDPAWLDRRISDGEWTFRAAASGNARLPKVTLWPRAELGAPEPLSLPPDSAEARVMAELARRGASFFPDLWSTTGLDASALGDALWELLLAGAITNDRFESIRRGRPGVGPEHLVSPRAARPSRLTPRFHSGRWSLAGAAPTDAEGWALRLLDRHGVVAREQVAVEAGAPPFSELLEVWKRMELRGELRRGYFVDGLSGLQFAWPQAVELLRQEAPPATVLLSACDPACVFGPILPSPLAESAARLPSNFLVMEGGAPALSFESAARRVRLGTRDPDTLARAALALATLPGALEIDEVDGAPVRDSPLAAPLGAAGFEPDGARLRRSPLKVRPLC